MTQRKSIFSKIMAAALAVALSWPLGYGGSLPSAAAATPDYMDIYIPSGGKIVNREDMTSWSNSFVLDEANSFGMFKAKAAGATVTQNTVKSFTNSSIDFASWEQNVFEAEIKVADNPSLNRLAQGGTAKLMLRTGKLDGWHLSYGVSINKSSKASGTIDDGGKINTGWISFGATDTITLYFFHGISAGVIQDVQLYFADIDAPAYNGNTFTTDGAVRFNDDPAVQKNELFLKQDASMNLALNFSEPVFPSMAEAASDRVDGKYSLMRTELYSNPGGDGFTPSVYYLASADASADGKVNFNAFNSLNLNEHSRTTFNMKYIAAANDSTGNVPLDPARLTKATDDERPTLLQRINDAAFVDGAGNPVQTLGSIGTSPLADNAAPGGTYRTIVDARPPQYSAVRNGVQPNILTGLVLNRGRSISFNVNLNEKVVAANAPLESTELSFANGMTAPYSGGSNSDVWTFTAVVPDGKAVETNALNTKALEHPSNPGDGKALWDYAHNYLIESVKSIAWADLSIDNTAPVVNYVYKNEKGAEVPEGQYVKGGSFAINAYDPDLNGQPSKGLFRPGSGSGLVYYWLSQSPDDPFANKNDNFAAVKRYSLTQKQPSEDLYLSGFENVELSVGQNGTTVSLPPEAQGQSGTWYLHTWTADMTWDSARQLTQYDKGAAERAAYLTEHPDATPAESETNFRQNIMPKLAQYDDLAQWPLSDFSRDDSNWSYHRAAITLDNDLPEIEAGSVADNMTDNVRLTFKAWDPTSTIKDGKVQYQFVKADASPTANGWQEATLSGQGSATVATLGDPAIDKGGKYALYVRATDIAGNVKESRLQEADVLVIFNAYETYPGTYAINEGPHFTIAGVPVDTVEYQYTDASSRPDGGWQTISAAPEDATLKGETGYKYQIPADKTKNGTIYAHIRVKQKNMNRYYYYYQEYKFDHLPPTVTFGSQGYLYPMPEQSVMIAAQDTLVDFAGVASKNILYQWIKVKEGETEQAPTEASEGWRQSPEDGDIKLTVDDKADNGNYRLYVYAKDSLGNGKIYKTGGVFATFLLSDEPPVGSADLIYVAGDRTEGYSAILQLGIDVPSQVGYFYSVSSNGGDNWSTWRPYTNYVGVPVDTNNTTDLKNNIKVKFKGYYGTNISELYSPSVRLQDAPAYALASLDKIEPVRGGDKRADGGQNDGLDIVFEETEGKTLAPTDANPEMPETIEAGKRYRVYQNGSYSFAVDDGGKSSTVFIVVSNFDDTPPQVIVKYSKIAVTSGSVVASLQSSEPIRITNLDTSTKTFKENGSFTFEYEDAVGFTGTAEAVVNNIDNTPPEADVVLHYAAPDLLALVSFDGQQVVVDSTGSGYDEAGERKFYAFPTMENVIASNLVVAEVRPKAGQQQDYQVVGNSAGTNKSSIVVRQNGAATFTITDAAGNSTTVESAKLTSVASAIPKIKRVTTSRIDADGNAVPGGKTVTIAGKVYSKGKIGVSLELASPPVQGNTVFAGGVPVSDFRGNYSDNGKQSLVLTDKLGNRYVHTLTIEGLDNTAPEIKLNKSSVSLAQNKPDLDVIADLGGYEVSDNLSAAEDVVVRVVEQKLENGQYVDIAPDLSKPGKHTVKYVAVDQVGNEGYATQLVYVTATDGMFVTANGVPLSEAETETAILDTATVTFKVENFGIVRTGNGGKLENEAGTFDLLYVPGLVREGQLKYIAAKLTYEQLLNGNFTVQLPKAGWYTIIVRNQEREQIYATLLVSKVK
ncbi:hypothetical protein ACFSR7_15355 [Cohnella sp. GCM10020058]|uniref:hypothetical protein n=1 Tax=Cohnella sp. GCM10020058 TaxID=3317330 RepID=UPI0036324A64